MNRNLDEVLFGSFNAFCDCGLNFIGFSEAPAYDAVFISDNNDGCESECAATFGNLGDAVDGDETILEFEIVVDLTLLFLVAIFFRI